MSEETTGVTTEDTPPERPQNVITSDGPKAESSDDDKSKDDQTSDSSAKSDKKPDGEETNQKRGRGNSASRRIKRLTKELSTLQGQADLVPTLQAKLESLESEVELLRESTKGATKPSREDFKDDEQYAEAYSEWKSSTKRSVKKETAKPKPAAKSDQKFPYEQERQDLMEFGADEYGDDWEEAMDADDGIPIGKKLADHLFKLDDPEASTKLIIHLHENRKQANELHIELLGSNRKGAKKILDELMEKIDAGKPSSKKESGKNDKPTKEDPPKPPSHGGTGTQDDASSEIQGNESMDDYATKRLAQEKLKRKL